MDLLKKGKEPVLKSCAIVGRQLDKDQVADIHHQSGHPGLKRILYFARSVDPQVSKEIAKFEKSAKPVDRYIQHLFAGKKENSP